MKLSNRGPAAEAAPRTPLTILYGSQSGNSEAIGRDLRKKARASGFAPEVLEMNLLDRSRLPELKQLLIVTSTFGEGDPPDNAKEFYEWLLSEKAPKLPELHYSVCALGDTNYTHFCKCGIAIDERLAELGATRIAPRVECDVSYEEPYEGWKQAVFSSETLSVAASPASPEIDTDAADAIGQAARWDKRNPFPATLLRNRTLNLPGSHKEVRHIELSLAGSGLEYKTGDALGLWPVNCPEVVEETLALGGFTGDEIVAVKDTSMPLRVALLRHCDIATISKALQQSVVARSTDPAAKVLENGQQQQWLEGRQIVDLFASIRFRLEPQTLVDSLRPLQPRLYSIASSPKAHPGQVHLTVGRVRYTTHGRNRKGVASTFLADRLHVGSTASVYLQSASHFGLPEDDSAPIIMVGPGTGIAPFRAFLEERRERGATGRNWLFFGDQHRATDFLYEQELTEMRVSGLLTRLDVAFSRDQAEKVYVQHRMLENGAEIWSWLEHGAYFYVCGDASRMAPDVDRALHQIVADHGHRSHEQASSYVDGIRKSKRYQRDVY